MKCKCFKCEKEMLTAFVCDIAMERGVDTPWDYPSGGVVFEGGGNFGSSIYDTMIDGIYVQLVICDDCLTAAKGTERMREMRKVYTKKQPDTPL